MDKPPHLLSQDCKIKGMKVAKAHPTSILRSAQFALIDPVNFLLILCLAHQYLASVEFSVSHKAFGILKIPIVYVGMA